MCRPQTLSKLALSTRWGNRPVSIEFCCSHCGKRLRAPDHAGGKRGSCPICKQVIVIPDEIVIAELVESEQPTFRPLEFNQEQWISGQANAKTMQDSIVAACFPYFRWCPVGDGRTSDEHVGLEEMGLDGTNIFRCDDPTFARWFAARREGLRPCRCSTIPVTIEKAADEGIREARRWRETDKPPSTPVWVRPPSFDPWTDSACELLGWGSPHSGYNDDDFRNHPANPDSWQYEDDDEF